MTSASEMNISSKRCAHALFAGIFLLTVLAGCGGGRNQGGVIPLDAPTAAAQVEGSNASSRSPTSSGPAGTSSGAAPAAGGAPTIAEQIAALERSGAYPALDRSIDIAGPDVNKNGVRDDIEAWINSLPVNEAQRRALMQDARATQRTLTVDLKDKLAVQQAGDGLSTSSKCGGDVFSPRDTFSKLAGKIEAMTANTRDRVERYLQFSTASSGSSYSRPSGNVCEP